MILTEQKNNEQILQSSSILSPLFTWTYDQSSIREITETDSIFIYLGNELNFAYLDDINILSNQ